MKKLTVEDITTWNGDRIGYNIFSISTVNKKVIKDKNVGLLEDYCNDKGLFSDMFNIEYMGYLTGRIKGKVLESTKENLITLINDYFKL